MKTATIMSPNDGNKMEIIYCNIVNNFNDFIDTKTEKCNITHKDLM